MEGRSFSLDLPLLSTIDYPRSHYYPDLGRGSFGLDNYEEMPIYNLNNLYFTSKVQNSPLIRDIYTRVYFNTLTHPFLLFPYSSSNFYSSSVNLLPTPKMEVHLDELDVQWISSLGPLEIDHSRFYFPTE